MFSALKLDLIITLTGVINQGEKISHPIFQMSPKDAKTVQYTTEERFIL